MADVGNPLKGVDPDLVIRLIAVHDPDEVEMGDPSWSPEGQALINRCRAYVAHVDEEEGLDDEGE